jgi:hypothetical protein
MKRVIDFSRKKIYAKGFRKDARFQNVDFSSNFGGKLFLHPQNAGRLYSGVPLKSLTQIKYLGFDIDNKGSYDHYLCRIIQKSTGILTNFYPFLSSYNIPFKLRAANAEVFIPAW